MLPLLWVYCKRRREQLRKSVAWKVWLSVLNIGHQQWARFVKQCRTSLQFEPRHWHIFVRQVGFEPTRPQPCNPEPSPQAFVTLSLSFLRLNLVWFWLIVLNTHPS